MLSVQRSMLAHLWHEGAGSTQHAGTACSPATPLARSSRNPLLALLAKN